MEITYKKHGTTMYFAGSDGIDDTKGIIDEDKPIKLVVLDELTEFFDPPKSKKTQEKAKKNNVIKIKFEELENYIPNGIYNPKENNSDDIKFLIFEALEFYITNRKRDTNE